MEENGGKSLLQKVAILKSSFGLPFNKLIFLQNKLWRKMEENILRKV
jgi:hypothetical protein